MWYTIVDTRQTEKCCTKIIPKCYFVKANTTKYKLYMTAAIFFLSNLYLKQGIIG